jgi:hypothetical protein
MFQESESKVGAAGFYSFAAMQDAAMKNHKNACRFSDAKKLRAERLKQILDTLYSAKGIHINFRLDFIAVKVEQGRLRDAQARKDLAILEQDWEVEGISRLNTKQGFIMRIPA